MDALSYVNIFETKGLEYLLVITFLTSFLYFLHALFAVDKRPETVEASDVAAADHRCPAGELCPFAAERNGWTDEVAQREEPGAA